MTGKDEEKEEKGGGRKQKKVSMVNSERKLTLISQNQDATLSPVQAVPQDNH